MTEYNEYLQSLDDAMRPKAVEAIELLEELGWKLSPPSLEQAKPRPPKVSMDPAVSKYHNRYLIGAVSHYLVNHWDRDSSAGEILEAIKRELPSTSKNTQHHISRALRSLEKKGFVRCTATSAGRRAGRWQILPQYDPEIQALAPLKKSLPNGLRDYDCSLPSEDEP